MVQMRHGRDRGASPRFGVMKILASLAMLCLVATTACTVRQTTPGSPPAGTPSDDGSSPSTPSSPESPDDPAPPASGNGVSVPGSIVGQWTWVTSSGAVNLSFAIGGTYAQDVLLDAHPGESCGIEYFTHRKGNATFTETSLTLRSTEATRTKTDSCKGTTLSTETIDAQDDAYAWRIDADDRGEDMLILEREGEMTKYYRSEE